jgi:GTP cyclohydrolase I
MVYDKAYESNDGDELPMIQTSISQVIRNRIRRQGARYFSNDNISDFIESEEEIESLIDEVACQFQGVLNSLVIDTNNDHNTQDTARRVAKMFVLETFGGRYKNPPKVTAFPNVTEYDQLYVTGPITIRSTCAHHFQNIVGRAYIGVFPGKNVIGLSKFNRITDWIASRPQIQEEMTVQIADAIERETQAEGVAILVQAEHHCMTHRGVKEHESDMTTAIMRGKFQTDKSLKKEFYDIIAKMK